MRLVINGVIPSKKNSRNIFVRNGRIVNVPQPRYKEWTEDAVTQLKKQFGGYKVSGYPIALNIVIYYKTLHRHDLDNTLGSIMDTLTDAQIIEDDDVNHISQITVQHGGQDQKNPRAEIFLED